MSDNRKVIGESVMEGLEESARLGAELLRRRRLQYCDDHVFSLGFWLDVCKSTGVRHVGAELVGVALKEDCWKVIDGGNCSFTLGLLLKSLDPMSGTVLRWDDCAPLEVKSKMAKGERDIDTVIPNLCDPRWMDISFENPSPFVRVWRRPILGAVYQGGFPVEFRVFVRDGRVLGVSSYYPQRPLFGHEESARLAVSLTKQISFVGSFTADWILGEDGILYFLEGGPPFGAGADPCCFDPQKPISGLAMSLQWDRTMY